MFNLLKYIRSILTEDSYLHGLIGDRISVSHISGINEVIYPLVTITKVGGSAATGVLSMEDSIIQIDIWSKVNQKELLDIYEYKDGTTYKGVRPLLHGITISNSDLNVGLLHETNSTILYDNFADVYHLASRYSCKMIKK